MRANVTGTGTVTSNSMQILRTVAVVMAAAASLAAQGPAAPHEEEVMRHYQAVLRVDSTDPPGNETGVVAYVKDQLETRGHRRSRSSSSNRTAPTWWRGSRAAAAGGRC